MSPFWVLRGWFKRLVILIGLGPCLIEYCKVCNRRQPLVWHACDDLWRQHNGGRDGGVLCPECFDKRAQKAGQILTWVPYIHGDRLIKLEQLCRCLVNAPYDSPEWRQAINMIGTIITEEQG